MKGKDLIKNFPKTTAAVVEWLKTQTLNSIDPRASKIASTITADSLAGIWDLGNPRLLFDFFDSKDLYVNTIVVFNDDNSIQSWHPVIGNQGYHLHSPEPSRSAAEIRAFFMAFKTYEDEMAN